MQKVGDALKNYVVVVEWRVQWAGWPFQSCTWEARGSFGANTAVVDHYNKHLDIFRDTPIEAHYYLQHLFDHEDEDIDRVRRAIAHSEQAKKRPYPKAKPRRRKDSVDDSDSEAAKRATRAKADEKKLAAQLFPSDDEEETAPKTPKPKRRPQLDDENAGARVTSRGEKARKELDDGDWVEELFGDDVPSPEKSQPASMAQVMQPRGTQDNTASSPKPSSDPAQQASMRSMSYSVPPMLSEQIAGRDHTFGTYKKPDAKTPGASRKPLDFDPLYDVSPPTRSKSPPKTIAAPAAADASQNARVKISSSQIDRDVDVATTVIEAKNTKAKNEATNDVVMNDIPEKETETRESTEAVEQRAEERLFVLQDPMEHRDAVAPHAGMEAQLSVGPSEEVKMASAQWGTVAVEEVAQGFSPKYRY